MRKNDQKWPVYHPYQLNRFSDDLETYARKLLFFMCIYMSDFVQIGQWESGQNECTDGRPDGRTDGHPHYYICEPVAADKKCAHKRKIQCMSILNCINLEYSGSFFILFQRSGACKWGWAVCVSQRCIHESVPLIPAQPIQAVLARGQASNGGHRSAAGSIPGPLVLEFIH